MPNRRATALYVHVRTMDQSIALAFMSVAMVFGRMVKRARMDMMTRFGPGFGKRVARSTVTRVFVMGSDDCLFL